MPPRAARQGVQKCLCREQAESGSRRSPVPAPNRAASRGRPSPVAPPGATTVSCNVSCPHGLGRQGLRSGSAFTCTEPLDTGDPQAAGALWEHVGGCSSQNLPPQPARCRLSRQCRKEKSGCGPAGWRVYPKPPKPAGPGGTGVTCEQRAGPRGWLSPPGRKTFRASCVRPIRPCALGGGQQKTSSLRRAPQGPQWGRRLMAPLRGLVLWE